MDWAMAIERNRNQLLRILAALFVMAGLVEDKMVVTLPRHIYRAVLLVLRPAESAVRRLVIIAARGLVLAARIERSAPSGLIPRNADAHTPAFLLIDPLKRFSFYAPAPHAGVLASCPLPRISVPGLYDPVFVAVRILPRPETISADRLCRRLYALKRALDNLPRQARRLACWLARQHWAREDQGPVKRGRLSPFRPGRPPGHRNRAVHEVDDVLRECHALALDVYSPLDTS